MGLDESMARVEDEFSIEAPLPELVISPNGRHAALFHVEPFICYSDVEAPWASLGMVQIDARTLGPRLAARSVRVELACVRTNQWRTVMEDMSARVWPIGFSSDSGALAFAVGTSGGTQLQWVDCATGEHHILSHPLNATPVIFSERPGCWVGGTEELVTFLRVDAPKAVTSSGAISCDVLDTRPDVAGDVQRAVLSKAGRYLGSQLAIVHISSGTVRHIGPVGLYRSVSMSPDGRYLLVTRHHPLRTTSTGLTQWRASSEVWEIAGSGGDGVVRATSGLFRDHGTVGYGAPSRWYWHPTEPATVVWLDQRDNGTGRVLALAAPFDAVPETLYETAERCIRYCWTPAGALLMLESERANRRLWVATPRANRTLLSTSPEPQEPGAGSRDPWRLDAAYQSEERRPVWNAWGTGDGVVAADGTRVYLSRRRVEGDEAATVVEALSLTDRACATLYTSPRGAHVGIVGLVGPNRTTAVVCHESPTARPQFACVDLRSGTVASMGGGRVAVDRAPSLTARILHVRESSGGSAAVEVFLPSTAPLPVPVIIWIHPQLGRRSVGVREPNRYVPLDQSQGLFLVRHGFGIVPHPPFTIDPYGDLDEPQRMLEQMAMKATALIAALVEAGVAERDRVGIAGHCLGAYAAAMLLGRTALFRAGVASAGRYNLASQPGGGTLTAHRRLSEDSSLYVCRSPLHYASGIQAPLLLLHGGADEIIPPSESDEMFRAVARSNGCCRYVRLHNEGHIFLTRDGVTTFRAEVTSWFLSHLTATESTACLKEIESSTAM